MGTARVETKTFGFAFSHFIKINKASSLKLPEQINENVKNLSENLQMLVFVLFFFSKKA
jgi:hypothetical protein